MATSGSFPFLTPKICYSGELDIKSPADRFMKHFIRVHNNVSGMFPYLGELQFIVNETNWEARTVIGHIIGNVISKSYKMVEATLTAIPRGDMTSSGVAWTVVFEKIGLDVQDREQIVGTLENLIEKIDRNLYPEPCPP
ncbi:hypothetical protein HID58_057273 [Brassica napus]|uniref:Bet v I/Major latex protein domain-containing protein n=1 Tax=Brassica napus TaxID=3708 RepID=A0ABQ8AQM0_BRANA|nr:hypothetical protein HID58_057273 [Brassica napus]